MRNIIKTDEFTLIDIPDDHADWNEISTFALTFDPILELGTTEIYQHQFMDFDEGSTLQELRRSLFLWQRGWNFLSKEVDENGWQTFKNLLSLMRKKLTNQAHLD